MADDKDKPNISALPPIEKSTLGAIVEKIKRDMAYELELVEIKARLRRAAYLAAIKEGFTEAQALELCVK